MARLPRDLRGRGRPRADGLPDDARVRELLAHLRGVGAFTEVPPPDPTRRIFEAPIEEKKDTDEEKDAWWRFPCASFEVPVPIDFPRAELGEALARHEALIRAQLPALTFLARKRGGLLEAFDDVESICAEIVADSQPPRPELRTIVRAASADRFEHYFGIRRALFTQPKSGTMYVVVADGDAVSLRLLAARSEPLPGGGVRRELVLESDDLIAVEPARQSRERTGSSWVVKWQAGKGLPVQEARTVTPDPPKSDAEFLDRLLATHEKVLRENIWRERQSGLSLGELLLFVGFNRFGGREGHGRRTRARGLGGAPRGVPEEP